MESKEDVGDKNKVKYGNRWKSRDREDRYWELIGRPLIFNKIRVIIRDMIVVPPHTYFCCIF